MPNTRPWFKTYEKYGLDAEITLPPENISLLDLFEYNIKKHHQQTAFVSLDKAFTYAQIDEYSRQFAAYLQHLNLEKGTRVAVMMPNILQYPIAMLGIIRAGLILVNINPLYTTHELEHQLNDSGAEVLIALDRFAHVYQPIHGKTSVKHIIITGVGDLLGFIKGSIVNFVLRTVRKEVPEWNLPYTPFKDAVTRFHTKDYKRLTIHSSDTAILQYTGGTTGIAKGAELSHRNLIANMLQVNALFESRFGKNKLLHGQYFMCALPLYHIFSFTVCMMYGMYAGATNILIPNPRDLDTVVKEYRKYPPFFFPAVNTLFNALAHHQGFKESDHSKLVGSIGGGMSVLESTATLWQEITGCMILEGYGLSETSPVATFTPPNNPEFTNSIGVPIPSTDIIIINDEGRPVILGDSGEICIKGPQVMKGYWQRPDETAKAMTADGYFRTGDIGVMDSNGYIKIIDRKKDTILVSGFNVYPNEIEAVLSKHPKVLEVAVIGVPDIKSGEAPKAFIVAKDYDITPDELIEFSKDYLTGYKRPRHIEFVTELPKSNVGKILRKNLRVRNQDK